MDLQACKKIVVFGGSFDPPHVAHIQLPMAALRAVAGDMVVYVPSGHGPFKPQEQQTRAHHRLAMLRLALEGMSQVYVLTDEIDRLTGPQAPDSISSPPGGQPTYTVETLESLRIRLGAHVEMRLLIGGDQLKVFNQWRRPQRITELAEPLVMVRPPDTPESLLASLPKGFDPNIWATRLVDVPQMDVSSTMIRRLVAQRQSIRQWVPAKVEQYIRRQGLYANRS